MAAYLWKLIEGIDTGGTFVNIALWGAKRVSLDMNVMLFGERRYMAGMLNHNSTLPTLANCIQS